MPLNIDAKNNPFAASIIELLELKRLYLKYSKLLSAKNLPDDHSYDNGNAEFCIKNIDECCISKSLAHKKLLQSACYYKLKILGKLLHLYALENKGKIPKYLDFKTTTTYSKTLKAFIKSKNLADENCIKQIFHCPEVPDGSVGYGMNIFLELLYSSEIAKVKDPSKICLLADSVHYFKGSYPSNPLYKGGNFSIWARIEHNGVGTIDRKRHNGGTNVLFLDGHVEWLPLEKSIKNSTFWRGY
jgi:prepilin-type processing-associated H-X9-DG protein